MDWEIGDMLLIILVAEGGGSKDTTGGTGREGMSKRDTRCQQDFLGTEATFMQ